MKFPNLKISGPLTHHSKKNPCKFIDVMPALLGKNIKCERPSKGIQKKTEFMRRRN